MIVPDLTNFNDDREALLKQVGLKEIGKDAYGASLLGCTIEGMLFLVSVDYYTVMQIWSERYRLTNSDIGEVMATLEEPENEYLFRVGFDDTFIGVDGNEYRCYTDSLSKAFEIIFDI